MPNINLRQAQHAKLG